MDPRATKLAEILIHHSLQMKAEDKFVLSVSDLFALELLQECYRLAVEAGAFVELDVMGLQMDRGRSSTGGFLRTFLQKSPESHLSFVSPIAKEKIAWAEKYLSIITVHDDLFLSDIDPKRVGLWRAARFPFTKQIMTKTWCLTQFPTQNLAERAGMSLAEFTDFYYEACLIDYAAESLRLKKLQDILDAGKTVRIVALGTDLTLGIEGRLAAGTEVGKRNVPDGECFLAPLETKTEGVVTFELPQMRDGTQVDGIRLEFKDGAIVKAAATHNEEFLHRILNEDPGNKRLGELGIGMNRNITKYIQNILFDEKIAGTVHMALGQAYKEKRGGGLNEGTIHWDLVKDLRVPGSVVKIDDTVIIRDGEVLV